MVGVRAAELVLTVASASVETSVVCQTSEVWAIGVPVVTPAEALATSA